MFFVTVTAITAVIVFTKIRQFGVLPDIQSEVMGSSVLSIETSTAEVFQLTTWDCVSSLLSFVVYGD